MWGYPVCFGHAALFPFDEKFNSWIRAACDWIRLLPQLDESEHSLHEMGDIGLIASTASTIEETQAHADGLLRVATESTGWTPEQRVVAQRVISRWREAKCDYIRADSTAGQLSHELVREADKFEKELEAECLQAGRKDAPPQRPWQPPDGYVRTSEIKFNPRFKKTGKNPVESTIQRWVERAKRNKKSVEIVKAPDTHENHYAEAWVLEQIELWNPRSTA